MPKKMILSAQPVLSRIASKFFRQDVAAKSSKVLELSPAVERFSPAMISLEDEFSKAISAVPTDSLEAMASFIPAGIRHHRATRAYCLENALIADGSTYCGIYFSAETKNEEKELSLWGAQPLPDITAFFER